VLLPYQLKPGVKRAIVDSTFGAPNKTIGTTALYSYTSSDNMRKVMAGYFDKSGLLQRFARYILKDGKVVDEINNAELSQGLELPAVRALLASSVTASRPAAPAAVSLH
jgi:outer membrane protein assembly factor BamE (lipoprotein component of BamABCDE complex)